MKKPLLQHLLVLLFVALMCPLLAAQYASNELESKLQKTQVLIITLSQQQTDLLQAIEQNRKEIEQLEDRKERSYFDSQKLEGLLRNSQELSREVSQKEQELRKHEFALRQQATELIKLYDEAIQTDVNKLEQGATNETEKIRIHEEIKALRSRIAQLKNITDDSQSSEIRLQELQIETDDTPGDIRRKADLLKDQEDKFRKSSKQLLDRKTELEHELQLRSRLNEMVTDISVWDQQEEALGDVAGLNTKSDFTTGETSSPTTELGARIGETNILAGKDFDISNLSLEQLEETIAALEAQRKQSQNRADSLAQRANEFYKAAENHNKQ